MQKLARKLGENGLEWELTGLLHDLDFDEIRSEISKHGVVAARKLKGKLPEPCLYTIMAHDHRTGFKPKPALDKAIIAVDSLSVLLQNTQDESLVLSVETLEAKLKQISQDEPWHIGNLARCMEG